MNEQIKMEEKASEEVITQEKEKTVTVLPDGTLSADEITPEEYQEMKREG